MDNPIQVDLGRIAQDLQIRRVQVESVVQLLDEGNTVPFITRYRKERTGNLNEVIIREIQLRVQRLRELAERKETILKAIEAQGKLTPTWPPPSARPTIPSGSKTSTCRSSPRSAPRPPTPASAGWSPWPSGSGPATRRSTDLNAAAAGIRQRREGRRHGREGARGRRPHPRRGDQRDGHGPRRGPQGRLEDRQDRHRQGARSPRARGSNTATISITPSRSPRSRRIASWRSTAATRKARSRSGSRCRGPTSSPCSSASSRSKAIPTPTCSAAAAIDALDRLILPSMEREVRRDLTEAAEKHAVEVFARNLRSLLLQPPIPKQVVLAIDPGFRTGCKVAVLDPGGNLLDQAVIYPHPPQNRRSEAKVTLKDLVGKHQVGVVAIGNGTACRETEELIAEIIAEGTRFSQGDGAAAARGRPRPRRPVEPRPRPREPARPPSGSATAAVARRPNPAATSPRRAVAARCRRRVGAGRRATQPTHPRRRTTSAPTDAEHAIRRRSRRPTGRRKPRRSGTVPAAIPSRRRDATRRARPRRPVEALPPISGGAPRLRSRCCRRSPAAPPTRRAAWRRTGPDSESHRWRRRRVPPR